MKIKNTVKRFTGVLFAMILAVSFLLPAQAATYAYNSGRLVTNPTNSKLKQAVTTGGSAYDDRGYGINAYLGAGVGIIGEDDQWRTINFTGSTTRSIASGYHADVVGGLYYCGPEDKK